MNKIGAAWGGMIGRKTTPVLSEFTHKCSNHNMTIPIDRIFDLEDVKDAINYSFDSDPDVLGENIGIFLCKEEDFNINEKAVVSFVTLPEMDEFLNSEKSEKSEKIQNANRTKMPLSNEKPDGKHEKSEKMVSKNRNYKSFRSTKSK